MKRVPRLAFAITLTGMAHGQGKTDYVGDVKFAVDAIEKECKVVSVWRAWSAMQPMAA